MSDSFQIRIEGLDQIIDRLALLKTNVQRRVVRRAVRAGANQIAKQARENAKAVDDPNSPEAIHRNITVRTASRLGRKQGGAADRIGVMGGGRKPVNGLANSALRGGDTWYWWHVELGTSRRRATPFMRPAISQSANKAFTATADTLARLLNDEVANL